MTGWLESAASSSCSVGKRFSTNCAEFQPPIAVMNSPAGTVFALALISDCTSAIDAAVSSRVSYPGRRPSSTM